MIKNNHIECTGEILPVIDALYVISGKWKLPILISIFSGNRRFKEIERSISKITSKVLAKELKDLEENQLIKRTVYDEYPVVIEYTVTTYSQTLQPVIKALSDWGKQHRERIKGLNLLG